MELTALEERMLKCIRDLEMITRNATWPVGVYPDSNQAEAQKRVEIKRGARAIIKEIDDAQKASAMKDYGEW